MDGTRDFGQSFRMETDWRAKVVIGKLAEGCTLREAALAAGISRQAVLYRRKASSEFRAACEAAREQGREEWTYRRWLRHPFRGKRPPMGKGHGGNPRFSYGTR
jgi:hypothetical protein